MNATGFKCNGIGTGKGQDIDTHNRKVILKDGEVDYDFLVVSAGSGHYYFGNEK